MGTRFKGRKQSEFKPNKLYTAAKYMFYSHFFLFVQFFIYLYRPYGMFRGSSKLLNNYLHLLSNQPLACFFRTGFDLKKQ
ncbi:MAG: hypothetical protein A2066_12510 [Bacteroidetes bacterium GWB2_41_8]|nr:MAG: hypothetical protein A2066_12510 [Bacteroidetes bacterium GWB2_41_8]